MLRFSWRLLIEGVPLSADDLHPDGWHSLDVPPVPPRGAADVTVPVPWGVLRRAVEDTDTPWGGSASDQDVFLELRTVMKDATPFAPAVRGSVLLL